MTTATDTGLVPMRVSKAVALMEDDDLSAYVVLDELDGDRHLVIGVGPAEAFALDASLQGLQWGRPMTYQFTVALVRSLGGRVREVRLDRIVEGAYAATVEVEGPHGVGLVDARSSDAVNLAVLRPRSSSRRRYWPTASGGRWAIPLRQPCSGGPLPQARWLSAEWIDSPAPRLYTCWPLARNERRPCGAKNSRNVRDQDRNPGSTPRTTARTGTPPTLSPPTSPEPPGRRIRGLTACSVMAARRPGDGSSPGLAHAL